MRDDTAFRSQQFTEAVAQRRDQYSAQRINAMQQVPGYVNNAFEQFRAQQQQQAILGEHQQRMLESASRLGLDELKRKQALEELDWAQRLHSDRMFQLRVRAMESAVELDIAKTANEIERLRGSDMMDMLRAFDPERMDYIISALGQTPEIDGDRIRFRKSTPEEISEARGRIKDDQSRYVSDRVAVEEKRQEGRKEMAGIREESKVAEDRREVQNFQRKLALKDLQERLAFQESRLAQMGRFGQNDDPAERRKIAEEIDQLRDSINEITRYGPDGSSTDPIDAMFDQLFGSEGVVK